MEPIFGHLSSRALLRAKLVQLGIDPTEEVTDIVERRLNLTLEGIQGYPRLVDDEGMERICMEVGGSAIQTK